MLRPLVTLDLQITHFAWRRIPRLRAHLEEAVAQTFRHLPQALRRPLAVTVLLANDKKVQQLNKDFRGLDKATNVLSFPQYSEAQLPKKTPSAPPLEVGDIALAYQYVVYEAQKEHKILINHINHLVIHGILHLLGYDHENEADATKMEKLEIKILKAMGLNDPYAPHAKPIRHKKGKRSKP